MLIMRVRTALFFHQTKLFNETFILLNILSCIAKTGRLKSVSCIDNLNAISNLLYS